MGDERIAARAPELVTHAIARADQGPNAGYQAGSVS